MTNQKWIPLRWKLYNSVSFLLPLWSILFEGLAMFSPHSQTERKVTFIMGFFVQLNLSRWWNHRPNTARCIDLFDVGRVEFLSRHTFDGREFLRSLHGAATEQQGGRDKKSKSQSFELTKSGVNESELKKTLLSNAPALCFGYQAEVLDILLLLAAAGASQDITA